MTDVAESVRKSWFWVDFWLEKWRVVIVMNVWTYERMNTTQLLIFFQTKIKAESEFANTYDSTATITVQNRSVTWHDKLNTYIVKHVTCDAGDGDGRRRIDAVSGRRSEL